MTLISLPRDIWIPEIRAKINSAYYWGKQKEVGGITYVKPLVEEIIGQPVEYGVVIDFSGFKEIIDILGGIDVNVERSFVDEEFPIPGRENDLCDGDKTFKCRYQTISFEKGLQHMDGTTALNFVRSRHAKGDEGTDFARDARQQKVIIAIKEKMLTPETYFSLEKTSALLKVIEKSVETDIDSRTGAVLGRYALESKNNMLDQVLPEDLLVNPPASSKYDYQYVFIPKAKDWSEVQKWIGENLP
jgi:LCP family protein required for cell wall assembly